MKGENNEHANKSNYSTDRFESIDIDSFAKGNLEIERFRQRTQMISYPFPGGETGRGSALDLYYESRSTF